MFDLIIIGGGPAGVTAALRGRELGASVALVDRSFLGGTCTNDGCVPTRVLARTARLMRDAEQLALYGLDAPRPTLDFERMMNRVRQVVYQVHEKKQLLDQLESAQVKTYIGKGEARFTDATHLSLTDGTILEGKKFIIAAGGHSRRLGFPGNEHAVMHGDVWNMTRLPQSIIVVGGGATGCQFASVLATFGARVTVIDVAPQILLTEDEAVAATIRESFQQSGLEVVLGIEKIERIDLHEGQRRLIYSKDGTEHHIDADVVLLSVGWPGNLEPLNLAAVGVKTVKDYIEVNDMLQTSAPHVYAAGDINGRMMLVQSASHQGRIAAENALLDPKNADEHQLVPHGGFTDPEYASIGLTEKQAREKYDIVTATVPYADTDRAVIDAHPAGFCKLIADRTTQQIIGAHVVGEQALEVVHVVAAGMAGKLNIEGFAGLEIAYPTFASVIGLAARQLARELGITQTANAWQVSNRPPAEWEQRADKGKS